MATTEAVKTKTLLGEMSAEFAGTMILILFGVGVVAQVVAAGNAVTGAPPTTLNGLGTHDSIAWAWGFGVMLGVYTAGRMTGAHINPAVTITLAVWRGFPWSKVAPYALAQFLGAFVAALVVRWNYNDALVRFDPGLTIKSQGVFSTLPGNGSPSLGVGVWGGLLDQIIGTAILLFVIFAIIDLRNTSPGVNLAPFMIGLLVVGIGMAWGALAGYAINPARDFGPRVASALTGYGGGAFKDQFGDYYFWVPIVGPIIGGVIGGFLYDLLVGRFLPIAEEGERPGRLPEEPAEPPAQPTT